MKRVVSVFIIVVILLSVSVTATTDNKLQFYFSPHIMDYDTGEIIVDLKIRNYDVSVPDYLGATCGFNFSFEFDEDEFEIKKNDNGIFETDEDTIINKASDIEVKFDDGIVSVVFLDSTLEENLIDRDGVLCRFTLVSKNPKGLWNSVNYYPIRFIPGSLGVVTYHTPTNMVGRFYGVEGIDGKIGGYNEPPKFNSPMYDMNIRFENGSSDVIIGATVKKTDAAAFSKNDKMMIPMRYFAENVGMTVEWDGKKMIASAYGNFMTLHIIEKDSSVYINSSKIKPEILPVNIDGRFYISSDIVKALYPKAKIVETSDAITIYIP